MFGRVFATSQASPEMPAPTTDSTRDARTTPRIREAMTPEAIPAVERARLAMGASGVSGAAGGTGEPPEPGGADAPGGGGELGERDEPGAVGVPGGRGEPTGRVESLMPDSVIERQFLSVGARGAGGS